MQHVTNGMTGKSILPTGDMNCFQKRCIDFHITVDFLYLVPCDFTTDGTCISYKYKYIYIYVHASHKEIEFQHAFYW